MLDGFHNCSRPIRVFAALLASLFTAQPATSSATDEKALELVTDGKKCVVAEMGYGMMDKPIKFEDAEKSPWCQVRVPVAQYKKIFRFCFVSGISVVKPYDNCSISVHDKSDGFVWFEFPKADSSDHGRCSFTCLMK